MPNEYPIYTIDEYGPVVGEEAMLQELYQRGPISCGMATPKDFHNYTGGIYHDLTGANLNSHEVSIFGYGVEEGVKFWWVRNSWGSHWGMQGIFKIIRGINNVGIENECSWAVPKDTWTQEVKHVTTEEEKNDPRNKKYA